MSEATRLVNIRAADYPAVCFFGIMSVISICAVVFRANATIQRPTWGNIHFVLFLALMLIVMVLQGLGLFVTDGLVIWILWNLGGLVLSLFYLLIQLQVATLFHLLIGIPQWSLRVCTTLSILVHFAFCWPFYLVHLDPDAYWDSLFPYNYLISLWYLWAVVLDLGISVALTRRILKDLVSGSNLSSRSRTNIKMFLIAGCVLVGMLYILVAVTGSLRIDPYSLIASSAQSFHYILGTSYLSIIAGFSKSDEGHSSKSDEETRLSDLKTENLKLSRKS